MIRWRWCPPFAISDEGLCIASLHLHGNVPLVLKQADMTPLQKLFLNTAIKRLQEIEEERIKNIKSGINKSLKDAYNKRKK